LPRGLYSYQLGLINHGNFIAVKFKNSRNGKYKSQAPLATEGLTLF
jgi:hypothetical protein